MRLSHILSPFAQSPTSSPLPLLLLSSLLPFLPLTSAASPDLRTLTLYYTLPHPSTPSTYILGRVHELATLQYTLIPPVDPSALAKSHPGIKYIQVADTKLLSFTPPPNSTSSSSSSSSDDEYTSILLYDPSDKTRYTSTSLSTRSFHPPNTGRFLIHLSISGQPIGARYIATAPSTAGNEKSRNDKPEGEGFDVQWQAEAPRVYIEKPGKGAQAQGQGQAGEGKGVGEGEGEEGGEKTLFQKYWWLLIAVVVLVATTGGDK